MNLNGGLPFTTSQARDLGLTDWHLREHVRAGAVRCVFRGVYVDSAVPDSRLVRAIALKLVVPEHATVAFHTAAWLFGVDTFPPGMRRDFVPHLLVPHGATRPASQRAVTRQTMVPDSDAREVDGVRATSPLRTTTDLLRLCWRPYALAAADAMVRAGVVDDFTIRERVAELRRFPRTKQARELAPRIDPASESHGESWMKCRLLDAGLPMPTLQHPVELDGRRYRLDAAYVAQLVAVEYDGREFHGGEIREIADDERRGGLTLRQGWEFVVATRESIFGDDASFEQRVGELLGCGVLPRAW